MVCAATVKTFITTFINKIRFITHCPSRYSRFKSRGELLWSEIFSLIVLIVTIIILATNCFWQFRDTTDHNITEMLAQVVAQWPDIYLRVKNIHFCSAPHFYYNNDEYYSCSSWIIQDLHVELIVLLSSW